jgi:hypothetical protein
MSRPNGPRRKIPAAIRAHALQDGFGTLHAERAFIAANPSVPALRRQVPVTAFTIGTKFQHASLLSQLVRGAFSEIIKSGPD